MYTENGWLATRFPKSGRRHYPADVLAVKKTADKALIHLIECKNLSAKNQQKNAIYISKEQIQRLNRKATMHNAEAFVAYSLPRQHVRVVEASLLRSTGKMFSVEREVGIPLKQFLKHL